MNFLTRGLCRPGIQDRFVILPLPVLIQIAFPFIHNGCLDVSTESVCAELDDVMGPLLIGQRHNGREILALLHTNLADWDAVETGIDEGDVAFRHHQPVFRRLKGIPEKINLIMHGGVCRDGQAGNGAERFGMICPEHIGHGGRLDIGMAAQFDRQEVIVLIYALRRCRSLQLQGHRITDRMIIIRDPEIPGMLALLVFNAPVPPGIEGKGLFRRAPAVLASQAPSAGG